MSPRLHDTTKWLWCLLVLNSGPLRNPVTCRKVPTQPSQPSTIETQAKFFQDFFSVQLSPYKIEFGHVCEDPNTWEQRYEKKDFKNHRDMGKVRWGDKNGGYGEHYWDLNHAGHTGDNDHDNYNDDGSYYDKDSDDPYDEPSEQSPNYDGSNYDVEKASQQEVNEREKRAPKKIRLEREQENEELDEVEKPQPKRRRVRKQKEEKEIVTEDNENKEDENHEAFKRPTKQRRPQKQEQDKTEDEKPTKEKKQVILVVDEKEKEEKPVQSVPRNPEAKVFVPYEGGAGVRQHYQAEIIPAASVPRLFLEPATGHVVDRATGQAYVLQPIIRNPTYT